MVNCSKCSLPCDVEGYIALKDGSSFHRACFTCEICVGELPMKFALKNGRYYHTEVLINLTIKIMAHNTRGNFVNIINDFVSVMLRQKLMRQNAQNVLRQFFSLTLQLLLDLGKSITRDVLCVTHAMKTSLKTK